MKTGSLRLRLFVLGAIATALALSLAWVALTLIFERYLRERLDAELSNQLIWFAANLEPTADGVRLRQRPIDPRFSIPFSGFYWQIEPMGGRAQRSRSLWDVRLPAPPPGEEMPVTYEARGPRGARLLLRAERISLPTAQGGRRTLIVIANDYDAAIGRPVAAFGRDLALALGLIGIFLTAAAVVQVALGLAPLGSLRKGVADIRMRRRPRLDPNLPSEVRPLVDEVNELLKQQSEALVRARAQASDLAHGLKTPLTVLSSIARRLARAGRTAEADEILAQVAMLRRRIDRQLARARLSTERDAATRVAPLLERLVQVMRQTPAGERLDWALDLAPRASAAADEVDLAEALGNILENASKWARSRVRISATMPEQSVVVMIEDDGPGVAPERREEILDRGTRLDEGVEGSGLGLAIASDIVSAYHGTIALSASTLGGLGVEVTLPRSRAGGESANRARRLAPRLRSSPA